MKQAPAVVGNAADQKQVERANRKDRDRRKRELDDLRDVLSTAPGRRLLWRLLGHCRVFESIWHPSALIHANAGKQDVGHYIISEIVDANEDAYFLMMKEARAAVRREEMETEAVATEAANKGESND